MPAYYSTQPPPTFMHLSHLSCNVQISFVENSICQTRSHCYTVSFTSPMLVNHFPARVTLSGPIKSQIVDCTQNKAEPSKPILEAYYYFFKLFYYYSGLYEVGRYRAHLKECMAFALDSLSCIWYRQFIDHTEDYNKLDLVSPKR